MNIVHYGIPFMDTVVQVSSIKKGTVTPSSIKNSYGGILNLLPFLDSFQSKVFCISNTEEKKSLLSFKNKKIQIKIIDSLPLFKAVIVNNEKLNVRSSYVDFPDREKFLKIKTNFKLPIQKSGIASITYIEDFPFEVNKIITSNVCLISDFNNAIDINLKNKKLNSVIKKNIERTNIFMFSDDEIEHYENFLKKIKPKLSSNQHFIGHTPKYISRYKFVNGKLIKQKFFKNNFFLKKTRSLVGNGDLFMMIFANNLKINDIDLSIIHAQKMIIDFIK